MGIAAPEPKTTVQAIGEQRVVFHGLSWQEFRQIVEALPSSRNSRLTFDDGVLEITVPLEEHEFAGRLIECFIRTLVELMGMRMKTMGSTTLSYPDLLKSAEPDNAYYIQNQSIVRGRNVDLSQDPPPDLVVEVDITHTDIAKNRFYANIGIPEFWRYDGQVLRVYQLMDGVYVEVDVSPTFWEVPKSQLYVFLAKAKDDEIEAMQFLRAWWANQH